MTQTSTTDAPLTQADGAEGAPQETETDEQRKPYVVVLMSAEMKAALKEFAQSHDTNPTALGRKLFALEIGYDISSEPVPTSTRQKYHDDDERAAAKKRASLKSSLLRKALFQAHMGQTHNKPLLVVAATTTISALADNKITYAALQQLDLDLDAAIKAGK